MGLYDLLMNNKVRHLSFDLSWKVCLRAFYEEMPFEEGPCFVLSFDVDHESDVRALPAVIDLLETYKVVAAFAVIGLWVKKFPEQHALIVRRGFEVINHTWSHPFSEDLNPRRLGELGYPELLGEIDRVGKICVEELDYKPKGFRTPHFGIQQRWLIYKALSERGYAYSSSIAGFIFSPLRVRKLNIVEFPLSVIPGRRRDVFDSWNYFKRLKNPLAIERDIVRDFENLLEIIVRCKGYGSVYFDPSDVISNLNVFERVLGLLSSYTRRGLKVLTYSELLE